MSDKFKAIGAYVSAGGFSAGMSRHAKILAHLGDGEVGAQTLEHNFPDVPHYYDHTNWPLEELRKLKPDVMYCAPPCAPWSKAGGRALNIHNDPRVEKVTHVVDAGIKLNPKIWIMESVQQMPEWTPDFTHKIALRWVTAGYNVTYFFTNYLLHNTPQNRVRFHMIAHRIRLKWPELNPGRPTMQEALDKLPKPKKREIFTNSDMMRYGWLYPYTMQGSRFRQTYRHLAGMPLGSEGRHGSIGGPPYVLVRSRMNAPALVFMTNPRRMHPLEQRWFTVNEIRAICGFTDYPEFEFTGDTEEDKCKEIGKGVLPALGEYLGHLAKDSIANNEYLSKQRIRTKDFRPLAAPIQHSIPRREQFPAETFGIFPWFRHPNHKPSAGIGNAEDYPESEWFPVTHAADFKKAREDADTEDE